MALCILLGSIYMELNDRALVYAWKDMGFRLQ